MLTYSTRFIEPPKFALSIRQPWAKLILSHQKNMEYRVWRLPELHCNTWLYLHVPLNMSKYEKEFARQLYGSKDLPCGGYIGYIMFGTPVRYDTPEEARPYASHPFCCTGLSLAEDGFLSFLRGESSASLQYRRHLNEAY